MRSARSPVRVAPRPSLRQRSESPMRSRLARPAAATSLSAPGSATTGRGRHAGELLHEQRGVGQHVAGVLAIRRLTPRGTEQLERRAESPRTARRRARARPSRARRRRTAPSRWPPGRARRRRPRGRRAPPRRTATCPGRCRRPRAGSRRRSASADRRAGRGRPHRRLDRRTRSRPGWVDWVATARVEIAEVEELEPRALHAGRRPRGRGGPRSAARRTRSSRVAGATSRTRISSRGRLPRRQRSGEGEQRIERGVRLRRDQDRPGRRRGPLPRQRAAVPRRARPRAGSRTGPSGRSACSSGPVISVVTIAITTSAANRAGGDHAEVEREVEHDQLGQAARVHQRG